MMRHFFPWVFLLLIFMGPQDLMAKTSSGYAVELASFESLELAEKFSQQAAHRLHFPLAIQSYHPPARFPRYEGKVINLVNPWPGVFQVLAFVGFKKVEAQGQWKAVTKFYPRAQLIKVNLELSEVQPDFLQAFGRRILVLGQFDTGKEAERTAKDFSEKVGIPFSTRGMSWNSKNHWVWPQDYPDPLKQGVYMARKYNQECDPGQSACISLERSEFYTGFPKNKYLVLAGVYPWGDLEIKKMKKMLKKAQLPRVHLHDTRIFLGLGL